ncbi:unnamed protein product, partial [Prorocentrum cordatum]
MGAPGFRERLLALLAELEKGATTIDTLRSPNSEKDAPPLVIIENTFLPALREMDVLAELLDRRRVRQGAALVSLPGEEAIAVHPGLTLIFTTSLGEPVSKDPLAPCFGLVDFQLSVEVVQPSVLSHHILRLANPPVFAERRQLLAERADLVEEG